MTLSRPRASFIDVVEARGSSFPYLALAARTGIVQRPRSGFRDLAWGGDISGRAIQLIIARGATMSQQHAEVVGSRRVAALGCPCERFFRFAEPILPGQEHGEFERAVGVASVVGAAICRRSTGDIASLFEEQA